MPDAYRYKNNHFNTTGNYEGLTYRANGGGIDGNKELVKGLTSEIEVSVNWP
jgi:hypothetical protein